MVDISTLTVESCVNLIKNSEVSATQITKMFLEKSKETQPKLNSFITICEDTALEEAQKIDKNLNKYQKDYPLLGVPIAVKDVISTKNILTTAGSKMLCNYVPPFDATAVKKLKNAGAIIIGKTNCDEFAMGSSNENSFFGPCRNPWDLSRVPGGSSGGSAAAVASCQSIISLGSDTGGSIRQPASLCGVVGLKPTYGMVSRYGLIAFGSSYDQIGPLAKNVEDCEKLFNIISGHDPNDLTSVNKANVKAKREIESIGDLRIGICSDLVNENINPDVRKVFNESLKKIEKLGARTEPVKIPFIEESLPVYYLTAPSEASSNLNRYDGIKYGLSDHSGNDSWDTMSLTRTNFGNEVKRRILLGTFALSSGYYDDYYMKAQKVRGLIVKSFNNIFDDFDLLVSPTSPTTAFPIGSLIDDPLLMYQNDICTMPANIAGIPAISIPCGIVNNLPVGLQLMGPHFSEQLLLDTSRQIEKTIKWGEIKKPIL